VLYRGNSDVRRLPDACTINTSEMSVVVVDGDSVETTRFGRGRGI
jgi:hypothetical protein